MFNQNFLIDDEEPIIAPPRPSNQASRQVSVTRVSVTAPSPAPKVDGRTRASRSGGAKCFCFTLHVQVGEDGVPDKRPQLTHEMDYICAQLELCPTTGKHHWQGYVEMRERQQLSFMKTQIDNTAHFEPRRGTQAQAIAYTKKVESAVPNTWFEDGIPHAPDAANMLNAAIDAVKAGSTMRQLAQSHTKTTVLYHRGLKETLKLLQEEPPTFRKVECFLYYGAAGTGKTRKAIEENPDAFIKPEGEWYDGLPPLCQCLILDDFYGNIKFHVLLRILDGYKLQVPVKGGFEWAHWTKVIITSNVHRDAWYPNVPQDVKAALKRRIPDANVFYFAEDGKVLTSDEVKAQNPATLFHGAAVATAPAPRPAAKIPLAIATHQVAILDAIDE